MKNINDFYSKLPSSILNSKSFIPVKQTIDNNPSDIQKYLFSISNVDDIKNIDISSNELLKSIFEYASDNRGDKRGKCELLLIFLIEDCKFSNLEDLNINETERQVKAYEKSNDDIAFGVENVWTRQKFGKKLIKLLLEIDENGENSDFREKYPFWFNTENRGGWNGVYKVNKFISGEITKKEFNKMFIEIPKLEGINHPYVNDINEFKNDIEHFNIEFNRIHESNKILLFVGYNLHSTGSNYKMSLITQSRIKMTID